jgi:FtsH-binding integral membrane protein
LGRGEKEKSIMRVRSLLTLAGLAFATWEAVDIFWIDTPAVAAVMACLFLACTIWFWRRDSRRAAGALLVLFAIEALTAPFLGAMLVTKVCDLALALTGVTLAVLELRRGRDSVGELRTERA